MYENVVFTTDYTGCDCGWVGRVDQFISWKVTVTTHMIVKSLFIVCYFQVVVFLLFLLVFYWFPSNTGRKAFFLNLANNQGKTIKNNKN